MPPRPGPPPALALGQRVAAFLADERGSQMVEMALVTGIVSLAGALVERQAGRAVARLLYQVTAAFPA